MSELVLNRIPGDAGFEFGTQASPFAFTHLVLFRVGRPQKPALFINKSLAPFRGATSLKSSPPKTGLTIKALLLVLDLPQPKTH